MFTHRRIPKRVILNYLPLNYLGTTAPIPASLCRERAHLDDASVLRGPPSDKKEARTNYFPSSIADIALMSEPKTLPATTADLTGRTILITGANVGLGKEAARQFLSMNPQKVVMTTRDPAKGQEAAREIIEGTNETRRGVVEVWELDLSSFESTVKFARRANEELDRLDIVILNAGILTNVRTVTEDGYETM
jgi:short chain dehydrogenase